MQLEELKLSSVSRLRCGDNGEGGCVAGKSGVGGASGPADDGSQSVGLKTPLQQAYM